MNDLEDITRHINDKISSLRRVLDLSVIVPQLPKSNIKKLFQDVYAIQVLLHEFEACVARQNEQLKCLKEFEGSFRNYFESLQHLKDNLPKHMPKRENEPAPTHKQTNAQTSPQGNARKKVKQIEFVTMLEYDDIPQYIKGRVTYEQLNAGIQKINEAVSGKYKILSQPVKSLSNNARKLLQRFKSEQTIDTKGQFFVVEADIQTFTQLKVDKRFYAITVMLRHCQRLRERRGGNVTRYMLL